MCMKHFNGLVPALGLAVAMMLSGCATTGPSSHDEDARAGTAAGGDVPDKAALLRMEAGDLAGSDSPVQQVRAKAVSEAALIYGAQSAYCHKVNHIRADLEVQAGRLDRVYDFSALMLNGGRVLPPVIEQADASYRQSGPREAITAMTTWNILVDARLVSAPGHWRNYLMLTCTPPLTPNPVLLPKDAADRAVWEAGIESGWAAGEAQAEAAFAAQLHRLTRDYTGMLRFHHLYSRGIVQAPILAEGDVGIRVEGKMLSVGQKVFRLTQDADFQPVEQWRPVIRRERGHE